MQRCTDAGFVKGEDISGWNKGKSSFYTGYEVAAGGRIWTELFYRNGRWKAAFSADYTDMENLVTWFITFGAKAEVIESKEVRDIIRRNAEEILKIYGENKPYEEKDL